MRVCLLQGSPRKGGNTAALAEEFLDECGSLGMERCRIDLYDGQVLPCLGCMACQDHPGGPGCVQKDGFEELFSRMADSQLIVLATPIYAFFCTAPMKALLDRTIYAGNKRYGAAPAQHLLEGRRLASIATCGYPPERGADLWEEGLKRLCRHSGMEYMGLFCRRDWGRETPFLDGEKARAVRDFAQALHLAVKVDCL